jgi:transposase InsO family protein
MSPSQPPEPQRRRGAADDPPDPTAEEPCRPPEGEPWPPPIMTDDDDEGQPNLATPQGAEDPQAGRILPAGPRRRAAPGKRLSPPGDGPASPLTAEQRLLLLDTWRRSGLPAGDFAPLVGISKHTLYDWKRRFETEGPAGLQDKPRGSRRGSRLPEVTKRTILMLKQDNPDWGCERISAMLLRGPALPASPQAVARVLHEAGYQTGECPAHRHPDRVRRFERARANQLWQTDLFTFVLKRQNRHVYLVAVLDDHSRLLVGYGSHASESGALVLPVFRAALASNGPPQEVLTDNGSQNVTWRGKSAFTKELKKRGVRQVVAAPRHPQTLSKIERFWGTLWRECVEAAGAAGWVGKHVRRHLPTAARTQAFSTEEGEGLGFMAGRLSLHHCIVAVQCIPGGVSAIMQRLIEMFAVTNGHQHATGLDDRLRHLIENHPSTPRDWPPPAASFSLS